MQRETVSGQVIESQGVDNFLAAIINVCRQHGMVLGPRPGGMAYELMVSPMDPIAIAALTTAAASDTMLTTLAQWQQEFMSRIGRLSQVQLLDELTKRIMVLSTDNGEAAQWRVSAVRARLSELMAGAAPSAAPSRPSVCGTDAGITTSAAQRHFIVQWVGKAKTTPTHFFVDVQGDQVATSPSKLHAKRLTEAQANSVLSMYRVHSSPGYKHGVSVDLNATTAKPKRKVAAKKRAPRARRTPVGATSQN